jgi:regulator of PEP synthase PpsR (kinase-PPPase family)
MWILYVPLFHAAYLAMKVPVTRLLCAKRVKAMKVPLVWLLKENLVKEKKKDLCILGCKTWMERLVHLARL